MHRLLFIMVLGLLPIVRAADYSADVLVYGATPAGVCAAVGAAREGVSVLLVEPGGQVGGVNTGGLCFSDSNQMWRVALRGLFEEFHQRIEDDYTARGVKLPYTVAEKDQKVWTYEPHVAARVTDAMLKEAGVQVLTGQVLSRTEKDGARLKSIATVKGDIFTAKTFVDASYEGDLMAAAGVSWVIGREGPKEFGESLAGKQYPKAPMPISGLDAQGHLLPLITTKDAGPDEDGDRNVMVYSFRLCLTAQPENRVPFPEPASYDPARFEAVRRYYSVEKRPVLLWDLYPLPGEKADANNGIGKQFSMGIVGGGNAWCEADAAGRAKIWEAHRQYTLELYKFLTTDPGVPQPLRDQLAKYGLCQDEFTASGHWSPQLYVREGRRMRGAVVMTQADILSTNTKPDPIAVVSFPIDSHDCQRVARGDGEVINEGTIIPFRLNPAQRAGPAYQVPYRAITPQAGECTNLLVPVALSATHVAYCSIRVEPAWMTIGHSAGIAAALAARQGTDVQRLDYAELKARLLAQKQVVDEVPGPRLGEMNYNGIQLPGEWPPKVAIGRQPLAAPPYLAAPPPVIPIDVGRQLFVDDFLLEKTTLTRTHHRPEYHAANPVLAPDQPWDKDHAAPFSDGVWFDERDGLFKMWYWARGEVDGKQLSSTCLATSRDGLRWEKPHFDVVPGTNIVQPDDPEHARNSGLVWLDREEPDAARRFKMFRVLQWKDQGGWRIRYSTSPDGVHWTTADDSDPVSDRTTVFYNAFRKMWVASLRAADNTVGRFRRYHEAPDVAGMLHWKSAADWVSADELDPSREDLALRRVPDRPWDLPPSQLYNLDCIAYESVLLGLFSIWRGQQMPPRPKINEVCVGYSRDGFHWSRPDRRAFCPVAANENVWNSGNLQSAGGCCLIVGDKLYFYVGAVPDGKSFADPGNVGLATLRRDGFASVDAGEKAGTLTTRKVEFHGKLLFVNVDCPQGELRVAVLDERGEVVAPFTAENCEPIRADRTRQAVRWKGAPDLSAVAGQPVQFRFHLTNGKLYAFWVSADESGASRGFPAAGSTSR